jgi:hypothetical protein
MNLGRHFSVIWRFKVVMVVGVGLGVALAVLAAFHVPDMKRRGVQEWQTKSDIFITQQGFPWGRVTLPEQASSEDAAAAIKQAGQAAQQQKPSAEDSLPFADPGRFSQLAILYSRIASSDQVLAMLPGNPKREQVQANTMDATGNGTNFLPMITITTSAETAEGAVKLNKEAFNAFQTLIKKQQESSKIAVNDRVLLTVLNKPDHPILLSAPSKTPSILAFLLCIIGAIAVAHLLESLRPRDGGEVDAAPTPRPQPSLVEPPPVPIAQRTASSSWSSAPGEGSALVGQRRRS